MGGLHSVGYGASPHGARHHPERQLHGRQPTASQQDAGAKSALCHELGHTFGLDHRYTGAANTCMDPFNYTNGQHQFYDLYDSNMLNQDIYVATDGSPSHNPGNTGCCDTGSRVRPGSGNLGLDATSLLMPAHAAFEDALPPVSG